MIVPRENVIFFFACGVTVRGPAAEGVVVPLFLLSAMVLVAGVQDAVSRGIKFEWLRTRPIEHQPPPDKWAYARRKLLLAQGPVPAGDWQCTLVVVAVV